HVVLAESDAAFRRAYARASLVLTDGMPLVWLTRLCGCRTVERVSGADLFVPLMDRAAERQWRVFLLGASQDVAATAARRLASTGVWIVGRHSPDVQADGRDCAGAAERIARARPDLVV